MVAIFTTCCYLYWNATHRDDNNGSSFVSDRIININHFPHNETKHTGEELCNNKKEKYIRY